MSAEPLGVTVNRIARISISVVAFAAATTCAAFSALLVPIYRRKFDMEMSYGEMVRHVRYAEIAAAVFSLFATIALWHLIRVVRSRDGVAPN